MSNWNTGILKHRVTIQPRRVMSPGMQMGLTVLLDVQRDEYLCPGAESIGFKVSEERESTAIR